MSIRDGLSRAHFCWTDERPANRLFAAKSIPTYRPPILLQHNDSIGVTAADPHLSARSMVTSDQMLRAMPKQSNPGPMFALVAGTRTTTRVRSIEASLIYMIDTAGDLIDQQRPAC